jgi:hypothetical protein
MMQSETAINELTPREYAYKHCIRLDAVYAKLWAGKLAGTKKDGRWRIQLDDPRDGTSERR